jgi:hypothetical protein
VPKAIAFQKPLAEFNGTNFIQSTLPMAQCNSFPATYFLLVKSASIFPQQYTKDESDGNKRESRHQTQILIDHPAHQFICGYGN